MVHEGFFVPFSLKILKQYNSSLLLKRRFNTHTCPPEQLFSDLSRGQTSPPPLCPSSLQAPASGGVFVPWRSRSHTVWFFGTTFVWPCELSATAVLMATWRAPWSLHAYVNSVLGYKCCGELTSRILVAFPGFGQSPSHGWRSASVCCFWTMSWQF